MAWPKFKTKEEVPAAFLPNYHEVEGEWVLNPESIGDGGKKALESERKAKAEAERRATAAEEKARAAEEAAAALRAGLTAEDARKFREDTTTAIRAEFQGKLDALAGENTGLKLDHKVKATAIKAGVLAERLDDFWALHAGSFELDSNGEPQVKGGNGKKVEEYIAADLKKARPYLYAGTQATGGGAGGSGTVTPGAGGKLTLEQIMKNPTAALGAQEPA